MSGQGSMATRFGPQWKQVTVARGSRDHGVDTGFSQYVDAAICADRVPEVAKRLGQTLWNVLALCDRHRADADHGTQDCLSRYKLRLPRIPRR